MLFDHFRNGINLGGWLSQYDYYVKNNEERTIRFKTYITKDHFKQIASWGLDHVRVPVDYKVLESEDGLGKIREEAYFFLDQCAEWCKEYHLNMIIDLHDAHGNVYGMMDQPMPLLTNKDDQQRFMNIWKQLTLHYKGVYEPIIMFELLNEVSDGSGFLWNKLYKEVIQEIRKIDRQRYILVGSNEQNSAFRLKELDLLDDIHVFYNFHFYDPQVFTHQRAKFSEELSEYNQVIHYPGKISSFTDYLLNHRQYLEKYQHIVTDERNDKTTMLKYLKDAIDFVKYSGHELYCGEFGVINNAPVDDTIRWINDCIDIFEQNHIGHALWNYKALHFGLLDKNDEIISQELINQIFLGGAYDRK